MAARYSTRVAMAKHWGLESAPLPASQEPLKFNTKMTEQADREKSNCELSNT